MLRARHPVHVTLRGAPPCRPSEAISSRGGFAPSSECLVSRAFRSFTIRFKASTSSRRTTREPSLLRKGSLWGDRYHRHDLTTLRQVRNALAYVYANFKKHGDAPACLGALDPFSSALTFRGWNVGPIVRLTGPPLRHHPPRTWLCEPAGSAPADPLMCGYLLWSQDAVTGTP